MFTAENTVLYAALFVGLLLAFEGLVRLVADLRHGPRAQINRRLRLLAGDPGNPQRALQALLRDPAARRGRRVPFVDPLARLVAQAGLTISAGRLIVLTAGAGVALFVLLRLATTTGLVPSLLAAVLGPVLPLVVFLVMRRARRLRRFEAQLPDALDLLVRSLRVGHPLSAALDVVAAEMPDPIGTEFGLAVDEITYGQPVPLALERMAGRIDLQDLRYLVVVVGIQYGAGGNLAEVLTSLARIIRERHQLFRKVRAITADGRISAWFLSLFPVAMVFLMQVIKPDYYTAVADHPMFRPMVVIAFMLLVVNVLAMRLMTSFRV